MFYHPKLFIGLCLQLENNYLISTIIGTRLYSHTLIIAYSVLYITYMIRSTSDKIVMKCYNNMKTKCEDLKKFVVSDVVAYGL